MKVKDFFDTMLNFLPSTINEYEKSIEDNDELLETVVIEDVFMPVIVGLLNENKEAELLKNIFDYFEKVLSCNEESLINMLYVTVLEILGNDKEILKVAKIYMGSTTKQLQMEADIALGRNGGV